MLDGGGDDPVELLADAAVQMWGGHMDHAVSGEGLALGERTAGANQRAQQLGALVLGQGPERPVLAALDVLQAMVELAGRPADAVQLVQPANEQGRGRLVLLRVPCLAGGDPRGAVRAEALLRQLLLDGRRPLREQLRNLGGDAGMPQWSRRPEGPWSGSMA